MIAKVIASSAAILALVGAAPVGAQEAGTDGWTVSKGTSACSASLALPGVKDGALQYFWSFRHEQPARIVVRADFPWPDNYLASVGSITVVATLEGEAEALGEGKIYQTRYSPGLTSTRITLNERGMAMLAKGTPDRTRLVVTTEQEEIGRIEIGSVSLDVPSFDTCIAELGQELMAAKPEGETSASWPRNALPKTSDYRWVTANDYPSRGLRMGLTGRVVIEMPVNRYGFATRCRIATSSGHPILDNATCRYMERRARFFPARDAQGNAVPGTYTRAVVWQIPE